MSWFSFFKVAALDETYKQFVHLEHKLNLQKKAFTTLKQRIETGEKIVSVRFCMIQAPLLKNGARLDGPYCLLW